MANNNVKGTQEEVTEVLSKSETFFVNNKKTIICAVVALVVVVAAWFVYANYYVAPRQDKASTELAKAQELFDGEQTDKAIPAFEKIISDYSGTDAANLAELYVGLCYAGQEKWAEAVKHLDNFSAADDAMISPAAVAALGNAYANSGNVDKAIASLKKAAAMADKAAKNGANYSLSATFLIQAGILLESQNKADDALAIYKEVKEKYVNAQQVQSGEIDKYIQKLEEK